MEILILICIAYFNSDAKWGLDIFKRRIYYYIIYILKIFWFHNFYVCQIYENVKAHLTKKASNVIVSLYVLCIKYHRCIGKISKTL